MIYLSKDYKEFIELLNKNEVTYLVVGAYSLAFHGYVRNTGDIDFWIKPDKENAEKVILTLSEFGFGMLKVSVEELTRNDFIIQLGYAPQRIDLITGVTGLTFEECWESKEAEEWDGVKMNFVSLKHLRINKKSTGRNKDLADLDELPEA